MGALALNERWKRAAPTGVNLAPDVLRYRNICRICHGPMSCAVRLEYGQASDGSLEGEYMDPRVAEFVREADSNHPEELRQWSWDTAVLADGYRYHRRCLVDFYRDEQVAIDADKVKAAENWLQRQSGEESTSQLAPWIPVRPYNQFARCPLSKKVNEGASGMNKAAGLKPTAIYDPPPSGKDIADIVHDMEHEPLIRDGGRDKFAEADATAAENARYNYARERVHGGYYADPHPPPSPPAVGTQQVELTEEQKEEYEKELKMLQDEREEAEKQLATSSEELEKQSALNKGAIDELKRELDEAKQALAVFRQAAKEKREVLERVKELMPQQEVDLEAAQRALAKGNQEMQDLQRRLEEKQAAGATPTEDIDAALKGKAREIAVLETNLAEALRKAANRKTENQKKLLDQFLSIHHLKRQEAKTEEKLEAIQQELRKYEEGIADLVGLEPVRQEQKVLQEKRAAQEAVEKAQREAEEEAAEQAAKKAREVEKELEDKAKRDLDALATLWRSAQAHWKALEKMVAEKKPEDAIKKAKEVAKDAHAQANKAQAEAAKWNRLAAEGVKAKRQRAAQLERFAQDLRQKTMASAITLQQQRTEEPMQK